MSNQAAMKVWSSNNEQLPVVSKELKSGAKVVAPLTQKAYGERFNLRGQELKRKYQRYLCDMGVQGNKGIASMIAGGEILTKRFAQTVDKGGRLIGYKADFLCANEVDTSSSPELAAQQLSDEQLLAIIEGRKPKAEEPKAGEAPKPEDKPKDEPKSEEPKQEQK